MGMKGGKKGEKGGGGEGRKGRGKGYPPSARASFLRRVAAPEQDWDRPLM